MPEVDRQPSMRRLLDAVLSVGSGLELQALLQRLVEAATELVDARYGALGVLDDDRTGLTQFLTVGVDDATHRAIGDLPEGHGILGLLIVDAEPLRLPDLTAHPDSHGFPPHHPPMTTFLGVPIRVRDEVFGNLYLTDKTSGEAFTETDEELAVALAAAAGVAIENARLHSRVRDLALVEDRERIARDLHDTVIQRLFAVGLSLQGAARLARSDTDEAASRIEAAIDELDVTVKHIRTAIFGLESSLASSSDGLRARLLDLARESHRTLGFEPRVLFDGPIDARVGDAACDDVLATLREALSNVARHAQAGRADIAVVVDGHELCLTVTDDGIGPPVDDDRRSEGHGVRNMAARAADRGGSLVLQRGPAGGTELVWRIPLT